MRNSYRIILACTQENAIVLDSFCGSAITGVVSLRHHRQFIGIDNEQAYLDNIAIPKLIYFISNNYQLKSL